MKCQVLCRELQNRFAFSLYCLAVELYCEVPGSLQRITESIRFLSLLLLLLYMSDSLVVGKLRFPYTHVYFSNECNVPRKERPEFKKVMVIMMVIIRIVRIKIKTITIVGRR